MLWLMLIYLSLFSHYVGGCQVGQFHKASLWRGRLIRRKPWKIQCARPNHSQEKLPRIKGQWNEVAQRWIQKPLQGFPYKPTRVFFVNFFKFTVASSSDPRIKKLSYTLEQGSQPIKYTGDTAHSNVPNPENSVWPHSETERWYKSFRGHIVILAAIKELDVSELQGV